MQMCDDSYVNLRIMIIMLNRLYHDVNVTRLEIDAIVHFDQLLMGTLQ